MILGIDSGFQNGLCVIQKGSPLCKPNSWLKTLSGPPSEFWVYDMADELQRIILSNKGPSIDLVIMEGFAYDARFIDLRTVELASIIRYNVVREGIPLALIPPNTIRAMGMQNGKAKDKDVRKFILEKYQEEFAYKFPIKSVHIFDAAMMAWVGYLFLNNRLEEKYGEIFAEYIIAKRKVRKWTRREKK